MCSSIGSMQPTQYASGIQSQSQSAKPTSSQPATPQDSVTLSPAAQQALASGDVDHDGDSH